MAHDENAETQKSPTNPTIMIDTSTHMEQIHFISKPSGETDPPDRVETPRAG